MARTYNSHTINVSDERIQLQTRKGDENLCVRCSQPINKFYLNGKINRGNRVDVEDDDNHVISYHAECFDLELLGYIHVSTIHILYEIEVKPKLTLIP